MDDNERLRTNEPRRIRDHLLDQQTSAYTPLSYIEAPCLAIFSCNLYKKKKKTGKPSTHPLVWIFTPGYRCLYDFITNSPDTIEILNIGRDRPKQTALTQVRLLLSGSTLFAIPSVSFGCITASKHRTFQSLAQLCNSILVILGGGVRDNEFPLCTFPEFYVLFNSISVI